MTLYHFTTHDGAAQILADGFRDSKGDAFFPAGVWLSDSADDRHRAMHKPSEGELVAVEVPEDVASRFRIASFPRWREFCIPAEIVNRYPVAKR
jgi:hypothetical protein